MTTAIQGFNQGGLQSVAGYKIGETKSIDTNLTMITGLVPEREFSRQALYAPLKLNLKEPKPCKDEGIVVFESLKFSQLHAPMNGYKTKTLTQSEYNSVPDSVSISEPVDTIIEGVNGQVINDEATRFKFGYKQLPARYGETLKAGQELLIKNYKTGKTVTQAAAGNGNSQQGYAQAGYDKLKYYPE